MWFISSLMFNKTLEKYFKPARLKKEDTFIWKQAMATKDLLKSLSLNYPPLDREHLNFFETIQGAKNSAENKNIPGITDAFEACYNYARVHFVHEERIMDKIHFPDKEAHFKSHATFIKNVSEMREKFEYAPSLEEKVQIGQNLASFLEVWFLGHVMSRDRILKPYLVRIRALIPEES